MTPFFKNADFLEETSNVEDLLDYNEYVGYMSKVLASRRHASIIGMVAPFGSGKSTLLNCLSKNEKDKVFIFFDAWRYPERSALWEGFVLEITKKLNPDDYKKVESKIDGVEPTAIKNVTKFGFKAADFLIPGVGLALGEILGDFIRSQPIRRVYQLENLLTNVVNSVSSTKELVIVLEDIDRSGDNGIYFLETLKSFIHSPELNRRVQIVVPIGDSVYKKRIDDYKKVLDLSLEILLVPEGFMRFIDFFFDLKILPKRAPEHLDFLFRDYFRRYGGNIRSLKNILRLAKCTYETLDERVSEFLDPRVFLWSQFVRVLGEDPVLNINNRNQLDTNAFGYLYLQMVGMEISEKDFSSGRYKTAGRIIFEGDAPTPRFAHENADIPMYFLAPVYVDLVSKVPSSL